MKKLYFLFLFAMVSCFSFSQILITEIADPNGNANARYIELYNMGATTVDFTEGNGWQIDKYTNSSATVSFTLDLTGTIAAGDFYLIGYDNNMSGGFLATYGFAADQLDDVQDGVAGSNGDDDLVLVNGADVVVDFFGIPATDNTNTCAEYEDGRAERLTTVTGPNATFDETEWNVWADSTVMGCTSHLNGPRTAPSYFDPDAWGTVLCDLTLQDPVALCDTYTAGTDTYTATINFAGGGTSTYTVTSDSGTVDLSAGDPSTDTTGTITVTGIVEGVDVIITVQDGGVCDLNSTITSAICVPTLSLPITEDFSYTDGSLLGNSNWTNHSGTAGTFLITSGQAQVRQGVANEDINLPFIPVNGNVYYAFDMTIPDVGVPIGDSGIDFEYFAHFKNNGNGFVAQVDAVPPNGTGDFSLGISSDANIADATWATDLMYDTTYRVTVRYNQDTYIAELWVDAAAETDTSIIGADLTDPGEVVRSFAFRQTTSSENEVILVDNLRIAQTFAETLSSGDFTLENSIRVYPNPTSTGFVNIIGINNDSFSVAVYDILGKQVKNQTITNNRLNVSNLNSGMYIIKITQNNASITKKLVIN